MKKKYKVYGLDCANCANKVEEKIKEIEGVKDIKLSYIMEKLKLEIEDDISEDDVLNEIEKIGRKIEPDFIVYK